jgi:acetyl esterase/lipase
MQSPAPHRILAIALFLALSGSLALAQDTAQASVAGTRIVVEPRPDTTFVFAHVDTLQLKLDLYLPPILKNRVKDSTRVAPPRVPFILWLHGGGWRGGTRADPCPALPFLDSGFAVASADYRLSTQAPWPAQIHDAKAALRWLRGHADSLGLDTARSVVWGTSAGGHLAALLGLTTPADGLEGRVGLDSGTSAPAARVKAVVLYHAPTDFLEYHPRRWKRGSSISQLLGCAAPECPVLARRASPAAYATTDDPPVLVVHGTADSTVPVTQAWRMYAALREADIPSELAILSGADHGGPDFVSPDMIARVSAFLARAFSGQSVANAASSAANPLAATAAKTTTAFAPR